MTNSNNENIEILQQILTGILTGSNQHLVHGQINIFNGYKKLGKKMLAESEEERRDSEKFIIHILRLGGIPRLDSGNYPVFSDVETQLKQELKEQQDGMIALQNAIDAIKADDVTRQLIIRYAEDENEHTNWLKQQNNLIAAIGIRDYLVGTI